MWPFKRKKKELPENPNRDEFLHVVSVLEPEDVQALGGLPPEAIAGTIEMASKDSGAGEPVSVDRFRPNAAFSAFLHHVIRTYGPKDRELQAAAEQQGDGFVYIIDLRTPEGPMGDVPPEDIIGAFAVDGGQLGAYKSNDRHLAFSKNGLVRLPPSLAEVHVRELKRLKVGRGQ